MSLWKKFNGIVLPLSVRGLKAFFGSAEDPNPENKIFDQLVPDPVFFLPDPETLRIKLINK